MPIPSEFPDAPLANEPYSDTLLRKFYENYKKTPNKPALISATDPNDYVTYEDLYLHTLSIATFLEKLHFGYGDVACLVMPNCWEYFAIFAGVSLAGGAISGASTLFTDFELGRQFSDSTGKVVFCIDKSLERVIKAVKGCPNIRAIIVINKGKPKNNDLPFGVYDFDHVLQTQPKLDKPKIKHDIKKDVLLLPYSSGTTGSPKGVMLSHFNHGTMMNIISKHMHEQVFTKLDPNWKWENENFLMLLPFYHIYGNGVLNMIMQRGATGVIMTHFDPEVYCRNIEKYRIRILFAVPPILVFLAKHPIVDKYDLSSAQFIMSGAAPAGKEIIEGVYKRLPNVKYIVQGFSFRAIVRGSGIQEMEEGGVQVPHAGMPGAQVGVQRHQMVEMNKHRCLFIRKYAYGMTECGMTSHHPILDRDHYAAAGRLLSNFSQKIVDPATGEELPRNKVGEVYLQTPSNMIGYLNKPEATAECLSQDNWYKTGDLGYIDDDGWLYVVDRLKELIKVKGMQVAPAELEDLLLSHPDIQDVAVIGVPDERAGELPKAFIVKKHESVTEKDIFDYVKARMANYKWLHGGVEFVKEIPKSQAGKILRRFLRDQEKVKMEKQKSKI